VGIAELAYPGTQRARQGGTAFVQLHNVGDVGKLGELEFVG
jgi:hypothetical protein